ncbi:MAG: hypothetical protein M1831_004083 [Alyxoria varia]|nr:MAG: hypothetical protein M1831_004083 [Alyxoria varia]
MPLDAHEKPPASLKQLFKQYRHASDHILQDDEQLVDFQRGLTKEQESHFNISAFVELDEVNRIFENYLGQKPRIPLPEVVSTKSEAIRSYTSNALPGLVITPSLIPLEAQKEILWRTLHRDLCNPSHKTNVHFHNDLVYPSDNGSFFDLQPQSLDAVIPKDNALHKPMTTHQFLCKKLRWMTLGGQYDWTRKAYPEEEPPAFPSDLRNLLKGLFPQTEAEAAIVNLYSPGDVLSLHRDVSETCDRGLISASIGCDAVFIIALADGNGNDEVKKLVIRLRSGDVVYMDGLSRYAWHGVPVVIADTCPKDLQSWPGQTDSEELQRDDTVPYDVWSGWMASKRMNLNVRQMNG